MGRWIVGDEVDPWFIVSDQGHQVLIHLPSPDAVLVTVEQAEDVRSVLAIAIGHAQDGRPPL